MYFLAKTHLKRHQRLFVEYFKRYSIGDNEIIEKDKSEEMEDLKSYVDNPRKASFVDDFNKQLIESAKGGSISSQFQPKSPTRVRRK